MLPFDVLAVEECLHLLERIVRVVTMTGKAGFQQGKKINLSIPHLGLGVWRQQCSLERRHVTRANDREPFMGQVATAKGDIAILAQGDFRRPRVRGRFTSEQDKGARIHRVAFDMLRSDHLCTIADGRMEIRDGFG